MPRAALERIAEREHALARRRRAGQNPHQRAGPVLSLGATCRFLMCRDTGGASRALIVHGGDLVVKGGRCQKHYQHLVPKQRQTRLSLNFSGPAPAS